MDGLRDLVITLGAVTSAVGTGTLASASVGTVSITDNDFALELAPVTYGATEGVTGTVTVTVSK